MWIRLAIVGLDDQAFIHHRGAQVAWSTSEHLVSEEARAITIVDNRAFDVGDKVSGFGVVDIAEAQPTHLARGSIMLSDHCIKARVRGSRIRMSKFEITPFRMSMSGPT